jgi:hypothetical protein
MVGKMVVEYSDSQKVYHINTLDNAKEQNKKFKTDYKIIGIFKNYEEASNFIKERRG